MPDRTDLASLRFFLRRTYPYLPIKFYFEDTDGSCIDIASEEAIAVTDIGPVIFMLPPSSKGVT